MQLQLVSVQQITCMDAQGKNVEAQRLNDMLESLAVI